MLLCHDFPGHALSDQLFLSPADASSPFSFTPLGCWFRPWLCLVQLCDSFSSSLLYMHSLICKVKWEIPCHHKTPAPTLHPSFLLLLQLPLLLFPRLPVPSSSSPAPSSSVFLLPPFSPHPPHPAPEGTSLTQKASVFPGLGSCGFNLLAKVRVICCLSVHSG